MDHSNPTSRSRRKLSLHAEALETREVMTGGAGNTFAIMQATVTAPSQRVTVPFIVAPSVVKTPHNKLTLGIDIAKGAGSTLAPRVLALQDLTTGKTIPISRVRYTAAVAKINPTEGGQSTAVLATIRVNPSDAPHKYAAIISGSQSTTGKALVGFFLPGDTAGGGAISTSDINTVKSLSGTPAASSKYNFATDANRDGIINNADLKITKQNLGVTVSVSPVISANLSPATTTAYPNRTTAFKTVVFNGTTTPGATVTYTEVNKKSTPVTTVADSSGKYTINVGLGSGDNTFVVSQSDAFGQSITGQIAPVKYDPNVTPNFDANGNPISKKA
jgi:hypothetical protein